MTELATQDEDPINQEVVFDMLISTIPDLKVHWEEYKIEALKFTSNDYADIAEIARFIVCKFKSKETDKFDDFFTMVETILNKSDGYIEDLMIVGLLEGIQNVSGWSKIDYNHDYDIWLKPKTKEAWDGLIDFWDKPRRKKKKINTGINKNIT